MAALWAVENLGKFLQTQNRLDEAELLLRRDLAGTEEISGPGHLNTLVAANKLGGLLYAQGKLDEAEPLIRRVVTGFEAAHGPDEAETLVAVKNLGTLLRDQASAEAAQEAEPLLCRAVDGFTEQFGAQGDLAVGARVALSLLLEVQGRRDEAARLRQFDGALGPQAPSTLKDVRRLIGLLRKVAMLRKEPGPNDVEEADALASCFGEPVSEAATASAKKGSGKLGCGKLGSGKLETTRTGSRKLAPASPRPADEEVPSHLRLS